MREFSFSSEERQNDIESILKERKQKIATQQIVFTVILLAILIIIGLWIGKNILYTEFDGYINADLNTLRHADDIYVLEVNKNVGDFIAPGDTLLSYVYSNIFYSHESTDSEPTVVVQNRNMRVDYGLARQDLEVLKVRIKELKKQLETEDHNIRFGLSDNVHKLNLERDYKETEEQLKAEQRKLYVLQKAINESKEAVDRLGQVSNGGFSIQYVRNKQKMKELGLVHYTIAADSGLVTKNWISELSLVLRGEDIIETQSFNLEKDNVYVMAYVTPNRAKYLNRGYKAKVIVNEDVEYTATVVSMGARTEEIPEAYRNNLSKDHIAAIAVLRIDNGQRIPFWSLVNGMPVIIRFNNLEYDQVKPEEYLILKTPKGLEVPEPIKQQLNH